MTKVVLVHKSFEDGMGTHANQSTNGFLIEQMTYCVV